ncbi:AMP-binding protein [bacterium]|nr:AMP-binding protein [bacterium]
MIQPQVDWLARWAVYTPSARMLRDHARDREWSYGEADGRVSALARHLADDLGIARGDRVAVLAQNRAETVFLYLACVRLGAVLVPLNFRLTSRELDILVADCEPRLLLVGADEGEVADRLTAPPGRRLPLADVTPFLVEDVSPVAGPAAPTDLDHPVMILYTAGTTGLPKGAIITHRMVLWNAINTALRLDITSGDHTQSYAPFFHTGGWHVLLTPFLHHGASTTILERFDADLIMELMDAERTTLLFGVPTMMRMLSETDRFAAADLDACRYAIVGGAPMPIPLINTWHEKGVRIRQGYGLTEVGPNCFSLHQDDAIAKRGSIGQPNFYLEARVVDPDGRDCPDDAAGELWLRGEVVTPGYWRKPEETAAAKHEDWFRTGDVVRRDADGFFFVVDRKKNMFISGGENVYPAEVEHVIQAHPAVREAAVIGVPDPRWGEVGKAFVSLHPGRTLDLASLQAHCDGQLARYKIPKHVRVLPDLPVNQAGKIDRLQLAELD